MPTILEITCRLIGDTGRYNIWVSKSNQDGSLQYEQATTNLDLSDPDIWQVIRKMSEDVIAFKE